MRIINKRANFDYELLEKYEAGIMLTGNEVKTFRLKGGSLAGSFAKFIEGELYLVNANIPIEGKAEPTRSRKLLLNKAEIISIETKIKAKKLTLVPTKMYTKGRFIKVEIALAKSKREFEKRESIKKKDIEREISEQIKFR
jgi:SsrA-binding protein